MSTTLGYISARALEWLSEPNPPSPLSGVTVHHARTRVSGYTVPIYSAAPAYKAGDEDWLDVAMQLVELYRQEPTEVRRAALYGALKALAAK